MTNQPSRQKQIIQIIRQFFKERPVLRAYLFGSVARMAATKHSDIDVLVELDHSKPIGLEFIQMQIDLENALSRPVDLVTTKSLSKYIRSYVDQEKQLVYEKKDLR
jgi:predicted nucleotidyltransferase